MDSRLTEPDASTTFSDDQRSFFDDHGYLIVENALPPEIVFSLNEVIDELYKKQGDAGGLEPGGKLNLRNCILTHDAFLKLLDWPVTFSLVCGILGWNIQMITSHLIVLPTQDRPENTSHLGVGLHRDGGTSCREMAEPHPRIWLEVAYAISDQTDPATGATVLVPGSNRLNGPPPVDPETGIAHGAISMNVKPGTAFLFEQRTWHGVGCNWSDSLRKTLFFGYAYRWVKPMDYVEMPETLIARASPVQRQLLGAVSDPLSFYLPREEDVPLKDVVEKAQTC